MADQSITHKTCSKCNESKPLDEFYRRHVCKACNSAYRKVYNKSPQRRAAMAEYGKKPSVKEAVRIRGAKYNASIRAKVIALLGGKCSRCPFSDSRALQVDHINGGGAKERRTPGTRGSNGVTLKILSGHTDGYQLLCANCNWVKRIENREHGRRFINAE